MYKLGFEEAKETEIKLPTFTGSWKKQGSSKKTSTSASLTTLKSLTVGITTNGKCLQRCEYQTTFPASWEICMWVKKQQFELNMEQWTGSKLVKAVHCHPAYLTYIQDTSCEMLDFKRCSVSLNTRERQIKITRDTTTHWLEYLSKNYW